MLYIVIRLMIISILVILNTGCHHSVDTTDSQGHPIHLADYRGKWLIINYWATWCKPCLHELPELNTLQKQHSDAVQVIGVNFDGLPAVEIETVRKSLALHFPLVSQLSLKPWHLETPSTLPITFIIDPHGRWYHTLVGPQTADSVISVVKIAQK